jgi:cell division protein FtsI/penicillin-binding protein 2
MDTEVVEAWDLRILGIDAHIPGVRWNPETEDEYQLLIDAGLLCVGIEDENGEPVPQIRWMDPSRPGCVDPVSPAAPADVSRLTSGLIEIYRRRLTTDQLVQRANADLRSGKHRTHPADLPFAFEWAMVSHGDELVRLPVRLWGVRTMTAVSTPPRAAARRQSPAERSVVLERGKADRIVLASSDEEGNRRFLHFRELRGLGPLLGVRDAVDGLDQITGEIVSDATEQDVVLTIDPDLQAALWTALRTHIAKNNSDAAKNKAIKAIKASDPPGPNNSVSAVVLDPVSGDILSVLNWPAATEWETPAGIDALQTQRRGSELLSSRNFAMLRGHSVGSTLKMLTLYALLDAGALETSAPHGVGFDTCGNGARVMFTRQGGRIDYAENGSKTLHDGQEGPLPAGAAHARDGVYRATGKSCNTYYALLATMLLGDEWPTVTYSTNCPVRKGRRIGPPTSDWVICKVNPDVAVTDPGSWLLLPENANLFERARAAFGDGASKRRSFFEVAMQAGYRLDACAKGTPAACRSEIRGDGYETLRHRDDWFAELGQHAQERVFVYPTMFTPGRYFGAAQSTERFVRLGDQPSQKTSHWMQFAFQAIGYTGRASALSLAALYAAVGRDDGVFPAPRLVKGKSTPDATRMAFAPTPARVAALRDVLSAPLDPLIRGTATQDREGVRLMTSLRTAGLEGGLVGKTGTFEFDLPKSPGKPGVGENECGVVAYQSGRLVSSPAPTFGLLFGSRACEQVGYVFDAIHRYPRQGPSEPALVHARESNADDDGTGHTSFVAVIMPPHSPRPLVIAIVSDIKAFKAKDVMHVLTNPLAAWLRSTPQPVRP